MHPELQTHLDMRLHELIDETATLDINSDEFAAATNNLAAISKVRSLLPDPTPEPEPIYVPQTRWEKVRASLGVVLDNETTRTAIKAGASFGGVALVVLAQIRKDHVLDKPSLAQANQRPS